MARNQYKFDPDSLEFKEVKLSVKEKLKQVVLNNFFPSLLLAVLFFSTFSILFDTPVERHLKHQVEQLNLQLHLMNQRLEQSEVVLAELQKRDDGIYRAVLGVKPVPEAIRKAGFGGSRRYEALELLDDETELIYTAKRIDKLAKQTVVHSKSLDEIEQLVNSKQEMIASLPAIQPISNKKLTHRPYGYGPRIDPVYKTPAFHHGLDFAAPTGTKIYATGNGRVSRADSHSSGYGKHVRINHGLGYTTVYGHMSKILVKKGQKVKRGDVIGLVGNTGKSVGPHLHYEVRINGKSVNPIYYFFNELSQAEYNKIVNEANSVGQSMD